MIENYINSGEFLLFQDEALRGNAYKNVEYFFQNNESVKNNQLKPILSVLKSKGLSGFNALIENNVKKNTNEKNKQFWKFIRSILDVSGNENSFRLLVSTELHSKGLLEDEDNYDDKIKTRQVKKQNRAIVEKIMDIILPVYFEHFNCHYLFYKKQMVKSS